VTDRRSFTERKRIRKNFGKVTDTVQMPDLVQLQKWSYDTFLQADTPPLERTNSGLHGVFRSIFPIKDFAGKSQIEYIQYTLDPFKYDVQESLQRGMTYSSGLRASFRLTIYEEVDGVQKVKDVREQEVYIGELPLMTSNGTFVVNGVERVIVSQMHRSPGVFFDHDRGKTHSSGKYIYTARVIPYRGSWLDFEFDSKDLLYVRIDRKRKVLISTLLYCMDNDATEAEREKLAKKDQKLSVYDTVGLSKEEILGYFYNRITFFRSVDGWETKFIPEKWKGKRLSTNLINSDTGEVLVESGIKLTSKIIKKLEESKLENIFFSNDELIGKYCAEDIINEVGGNLYADAGTEITQELLAQIGSVSCLNVLDIDHVSVGAYLRNTMASDKNSNREEAVMDIYKILRPGEPPTLEAADALFYSLFFDSDRYDLSAVGRVKIKEKLGLNISLDKKVLTKTDILLIVKNLLDIKDGRGDIDDIDNLSNRRVRSVGELLENQYKIGLLRTERFILERLSTVDLETAVPNDIINAKPAMAVIREFFGSSQLSQFMDQTNPLSEITHKRRVSALGPGGLTRERSNFEVRDVHPTHYSRICPIETPEGQNIGLINSLATYAKVNQYGFIEAPYKKVIDGKVTDQVKYLSAMEESKYTIAPPNLNIDENNNILNEYAVCRRRGDYVKVHKSEIHFMDISSKQSVSVAAALIPFLENDDSNRALMGSNMQRQAVPLIKSEAPLVGTGVEKTVARDSRAMVIAKRSGYVDQVDSNRIVIKVDQITAINASGVDIYNLKKFQRSNHNTCINHKPLVAKGDLISAGDIIADGPSTDLGELGLGKNVLVAFMQWRGYGFEDSIIISEKIVKDDVFTSIHIEEFEVMARDTKLGHEEITRDIPNISDESLRNLDEAGIVCIGAEVGPGDVLVGRVTPKGESPMTPEEKLLRAIFGEKSSDIRDTSLRTPPGVSGTIVDVRIFSRSGAEKDERSLAIEHAEIERFVKDRDAEKRILEKDFYERLETILINQKVTKAPAGESWLDGKKISKDDLDKITKGQRRYINVENPETSLKIEELKLSHDAMIQDIQKKFENKVAKLQRGDDMVPGVLKIVKVFIAVKRKLQPGDKMAGRHGNKGVVSVIVPEEDMPYLEDGTQIDVILNPLGLPSRMNVGQIFETHLGWASYNLGRQVAALLKEIKNKKKSVKDLREYLHDIYEKKEQIDEVEALDDDEVIVLANNLKGGIPMICPVFDGAKQSDIDKILEKSGVSSCGQVDLYDGRTGEKFERKITVGMKYVLKLHHLVADKLHARSTGPYSLVTQQPLGGKAQFGGQRFGEMEVWAAQGYGAAFFLKEILTVKSDDMDGRTKAYEAIVRGNDTHGTGLPASFSVLIKELRSLSLDIDFIQEEKPDQNPIIGA
jgi:DNA-directed RNA polymerase subunit beta